MRFAGAVLCLALAVEAGEIEVAEVVRRHTHAGEYAAALSAADAFLVTDPDSRLVRYVRAQAVLARVRQRQRDDGYAAALDDLERNLTDELLVRAYSDLCLWAGEEERGIRTLRASGTPLRWRIEQELQLLSYLRRYDEAAHRAAQVGWADWQEWAAREAQLRATLLDRAKRGWRMAGLGLAFNLALAVIAFWLARTRKAHAAHGAE